MFYIFISIIVALIGLLIYLLSLLKSDKKDKADISVEVINRNVENKHYRYSNNYFSRSVYMKLLNNYRTLGVFSDMECKRRAQKSFEFSVAKSILVPSIAMLVTKDLIITLSTFIFALVMYEVLVNKEIDRVYKTLLDDVTVYIDSVKLNYMQFGNVPRALEEADTGKYLDGVNTRLINVLTQINAEENLRIFIDTTPLHIINSLALVCTLIDEYGDNETKEGNSLFVEQLNLLEKENNLTRKTIKKQEALFMGLDVTVLAGIMVIPGITYFFQTTLPGGLIVLEGFLGYCIKVAIIMITTVIYHVIATVNRKRVVVDNDVPGWVIKYMLDNPKVMKYIKYIQPNTLKTRQKLVDSFEDKLSQHTIDSFYCVKVVHCLFLFIATLCIINYLLFVSRPILLKNIQPITLTKVEYTVDQARTLRALDREFILMPVQDRPKDEALVMFVTERIGGYFKDMELYNQVERLKSKTKLYDSLKFNQTHFLVCVVMAYIGWFSPEMLLQLRKYQVYFEGIEDISRLQTVLITLAGTNMSVWDILFYLKLLSTVHKDVIDYCIQEYTQNPEKALDNLEYKAVNKDFERMCVKLKKSISELPVQDAFANAKVEKEYLLSIKEIEMDTELRNKVSWIQMLSNVPLFLSLFSLTGVPMAVIALGQLQDMFK